MDLDLDELERLARAGCNTAPYKVMALISRVRELEAEVARLRVTLDTAASQAVIVAQEAKTLAGVLKEWSDE